MTELVPFLKNILSVPGLSAHEDPARKLVEDEWRPLVDELHVSRMGSVEALRRGRGDKPRPSILLAAHMDAIGLIASQIVHGFIRFTQIGGIDPRILPGQQVLVHGVETLPGIVVQPPAALLPVDPGKDPVPMEQLLVDVGLEPEQVERLVHVGDPISFATLPVELQGETLYGHTLDDRASVAAVTHCLQLLQHRVHAYDVWAVATIQEETSFGGSYTSGYGLNADLGIAIDVCHAQGPGTTEPTIPELGKGLALGWGANSHPYLFKTLKDLADEFEIPYCTEVYPSHSGTDAYALQMARGGKPTMVISIPLRYMHTPVETVSLKDIRRVGRLLAELITRLDDNYLDQITWEVK